MKKKLGLVFMAAMIGLVSTAAYYYAVDLSGDWTLNKGKSELGEWGDRIAPTKLKIATQTGMIAVDRTGANFEGQEVVSNEKLMLDGKETESTVFGNSKKKSVAKWSDDGQSLKVTSTIVLDINGQTTDIKVEEEYKLAENGQALSLVSTSNSSYGTSTMKLVYDKAK
ncbi:MAG TPA: hypothetical protein VM935_03070 [Chitinophagaceae bacterium]|jgi:hypothetical protein|nr:hypothetical protein [Chitinophagaceae bacterium]